MSDIIVARQFEGVLKKFKFTEGERKDLEAFNYLSNVNRYTEAGRRLYATQIFEKAVNTIQTIVESNFPKPNLSQRTAKQGTKFMMFSAHDTQIAILWNFLNATNISQETVPYASFL